ncbi:hypothetical protein M9H77_17881 [Catharanthus roseus]|uniref:Uncharacterized protein n=1 Tax=Catharanthus roseus TaxID=4058 RepID=A0ACC0B5V5_CATRO|nr:hypothetical protein M9H77_17881 [Catharanthus roseus]
MEEVSTHVHPGPIVPDVLTRQHEHRSSHFSCYKVKKELLEAWILRMFMGSETDNDLILCARGFIFLLLGSHMLPDFSENLVHTVLYGSFRRCTTDRGSLSLSTDLGWRLRVRDGHALAVKVLSYPNDEYIRWYRGITLVYIRNPSNRDTRSIGYQPARVDRRMMKVDDITSVVIQELPSFPS